MDEVDVKDKFEMWCGGSSLITWFDGRLVGTVLGTAYLSDAKLWPCVSPLTVGTDNLVKNTLAV
eukprot:1911259-Amphidinium_carterae.2